MTSNPLAEVTATGEAANKAIMTLGLERTDAMLGEGRCPICTSRSGGWPVIEVDEEEVEGRTPHAIVNCVPCQVRWRAGLNAENGMPWIEHARNVQESMTLTMMINAPSESDDTDEEDW